MIADFTDTAQQSEGRHARSQNQLVEPPNHPLMPNPLRQLTKYLYSFLHTRHIRFKALIRIIIQRHLEIIMDAPFVQLMQVRQYRLRILRPKHNDLATRKGHIHFLLSVERIIPDAIAFCQAVEEPLRVKGRDIGGTAGGDDDGGDGINAFTAICNGKQFINHDTLIVINLLTYPSYNYFPLTKELHLDF